LVLPIHIAFKVRAASLSERIIPERDTPDKATRLADQPKSLL
jgi:ATP-dependent Clp protease ATP-binding subunit ClpA